MNTKLNSEVWELWLRRYDEGTAKVDVVVH
jgi:hypothetical protein